MAFLQNKFMVDVRISTRFKISARVWIRVKVSSYNMMVRNRVKV